MNCRIAQCAALVGFLMLQSGASAADLIRVADSQKGSWEQTLIELGRDKGIFKKYDIDLEILWTDGGADSQQAVIAGSMDIAIGTGTLGVISAYAKGAPVEILSASMTGASDLYWFVRHDSPVKTFRDSAGKTVAFSRPGSSTNVIALALIKEAGTDAKLVPAGGPAASMTQVMSGQVDIGWSVVPVGLDREATGQIRVIASGNDVAGVRDQTVRVNIVNRDFYKENPDLVKRFMKAYQETFQWAYDTDEALELWSKMNQLDLAAGKKARDRGCPREAVQLFPVRGMDRNIAEAIESKRLNAPLPPEKVSEMLAVSKELQQAIGG
ncbi:ABC transporter substrate-binding protein [Rhizobium sp. WYJ-E13]|uniref:ABC transporter substrate-binding protein n=1 Tax=Rhizobium sp. WYJ-E13 TaxID=2849093 RepID=UPI001C1F1E55|nr:ABC transporter substrate-binding protein [Rhizobium sp. WYJ-E13]QWW72375.1 ABC transporter substrate-binding protein [Rhizobium sp. WYJ-E13]